MYNVNNVRRIKLAIRIFLISLVIVPTILMVSTIAKSAGLESKVSLLSQELDKTKVLLTEEQTRNDNHPDFAVDANLLKYGSCGKPILNIFPDMTVDWRRDPVCVANQPTVYLTFDDGPSKLTPEVLDILDKYQVKATFFVVGTQDEELQKMYKETVDRGHTLGMHSYTHNYEKIYASSEAFLSDFYDLFTLLKSTTGETPVLFRFPGGANNDRLFHSKLTKNIVDEMTSRGFIYHDWNVASDDAAFRPKTKDEIWNNVVKGVMGKTHAVVLLHNSAGKYTTVEALPAIIETLQARGYRFDKLTSATKPIHFA